MQSYYGDKTFMNLLIYTTTTWENVLVNLLHFVYCRLLSIIKVHCFYSLVLTVYLLVSYYSGRGPVHSVGGKTQAPIVQETNTVTQSLASVPY